MKCAACGGPLAPDQRYCLECGARSPQVGGVLPGDLQALISPKQSPAVAGANPAAPAGAAVTEHPPSANTPAVIAGVGVLLLSMGVGVLIGRSSSSTSKVPAIPAQVISVSTSAASPGTGTGAGQTPALNTTTPTSTGSSSKHGSKSSSSKSSSTESSSGGVGQTTNKTAPPSVLDHLRGGKGETYEQKSKNLPDKISTG